MSRWVVAQPSANQSAVDSSDFSEIRKSSVISEQTFENKGAAMSHGTPLTSPLRSFVEKETVGRNSFHLSEVVTSKSVDESPESDQLQTIVEFQAVEIDRLKAEFDKLLHERSTSKERESRVGSPNIQSRRISSVTDDLRSHRHVVGQLRKVLKEASDNIPQSRQSAAAEARNADERSRAYEVTQELRHCQESLREETLKKTRLISEVEKLEARVKDMKADLLQLSSQLESTRTQRTQLSSELQTQRKQISELTEALAREKLTNSNVEGQMGRLHKLQQELQLLKTNLVEEQLAHQQLMSEMDHLRKMELFEAKKVGELSAEVSTLKCQINTQELEKLELQSDVEKAQEKANTFEMKLQEARNLQQKAKEELSKIKSESSAVSSLRLEELKENVTRTQSENQKLKDEVNELRTAQCSQHLELGKEIKQLTDCLKQERTQKMTVQDELHNFRNAEANRYEELSREVEILCSTLEAERLEKSELTSELLELKRETIRVVEASQESKALGEQFNKEVSRNSSLSEELRQLQSMHNSEVMNTSRLRNELRCLHEELAEVKELRRELSEKLHLLETRPSSTPDLSTELKAENELLWTRLEEAKATEAELMNSMTRLRASDSKPDQLIQEVGALNSQIDSLRELLLSVECDVSGSSLNERVEFLINKLSSTNQELKAVKVSLDNAECAASEQSQLKDSKLSEMADRNERYLREIEELKEQIKSIEIELQDILLQKVTAEEELVSLRYQLGSLRTSSNEGRSSVGDLEERLSNTLQQLKEKEEKLFSVTAEIEALRAAVETKETEEEIGELRKKADELAAVVGRQDSEIENKKKEIGDLLKKVSGAELKSTETNEELMTTRRFLEAAEEELLATKERLEILELNYSKLCSNQMEGKMEANSEEREVRMKLESSVNELQAKCASLKATIGALEGEKFSVECLMKENEMQMKELKKTIHEMNIHKQTDVDSLQVQLKHLQLGFIKEMEKVKTILSPPLGKISGPSTRNCLAKLQELVSGKFEFVSPSIVPAEASAREFQMETARLHGVAISQKEQIKTIECELEACKKQLHEVENGWKEEFRFYKARESNLESSLREQVSKNEKLQVILEKENSKPKEAEKRPKTVSPKHDKAEEHQREATKKMELQIGVLETKLNQTEIELKVAQDLLTLQTNIPTHEELSERRFYMGFMCVLVGLFLGILFV